jgi:hypothetical protein
MCDLTDAERQYLTETRSLTRDEVGREVLVGLTHEESAALMAHRRRFSAGNRQLDTAALSMWLELAEKHAHARPLSRKPGGTNRRAQSRRGDSPAALTVEDKLSR